MKKMTKKLALGMLEAQDPSLQARRASYTHHDERGYLRLFVSVRRRFVGGLPYPEDLGWYITVSEGTTTGYEPWGFVALTGDPVNILPLTTREARRAWVAAKQMLGRSRARVDTF